MVIRMDTKVITSWQMSWQRCNQRMKSLVSSSFYRIQIEKSVGGESNYFHFSYFY